jgi:hypothetical protein
MRSNLGETSDIDRLHEVLEGDHLLFQVVGGDLQVFDDTSNDQFVHSVGNGFLLVPMNIALTPFALTESST